MLLNMKDVFSSINNILTLKATYAFLDWLEKYTKFVTPDDISKVKMVINGQKENSNGFDVMFPNDYPKIIAEVKCNKILEGKNRFDAAQLDGILNDIDKLLNSGEHKKVSNLKDKVKDAYKFLVIANVSDNIDAAIAGILNYEPRKEELKEKIKNNLQKVKVVDPDNIPRYFSPDIVYIIKVNIN